MKLVCNSQLFISHLKEHPSHMIVGALIGPVSVRVSDGLVHCLPVAGVVAPQCVLENFLLDKRLIDLEIGEHSEIALRHCMKTCYLVMQQQHTHAAQLCHHSG